MMRSGGLTLADAVARPGGNHFHLLRLVAAWLVIYGHAYAVTADPGQDLLLRWLSFKFAGGIAVDVFFIISGFLIVASMQRNRLRDYLAARALRILPALVVCVALCVLVLGPLFTTAAHYWSDPETWRYLRVNIGLQRVLYTLPGVFETHPNTAVNGSLWTLPIEARLYLVVALLGVLGLLRRRWLFNLAALATLLLAAVWLPWGQLTPAEVNWLYCSGFFLAGAACWINRDRIPLSWPVLAGVLALATLLHGGRGWVAGYALALVYGTLFIAYVPRLPPIRHTDLSYGLYLYGWPSQQVVVALVPQADALGNTALATLLALGLAWLSWRWVERPALALKPGRRTAPVPASAPTPASAEAGSSSAPGA